MDCSSLDTRDTTSGKSRNASENGAHCLGKDQQENQDSELDDLGLNSVVKGH